MQYIKYFTALFVLVLITIACNSDKSDKQNSDNQKKNQTDPVKKEPKDQYRDGETFQDDKNQLINLIQGPATFKVSYVGDSHFIATIKDADDKVIDVLADVNGNYKGTKTITAPKTDVYILDVRCKGSWTIYRE